MLFNISDFGALQWYHKNLKKVADIQAVFCIFVNSVGIGLIFTIHSTHVVFHLILRFSRTIPQLLLINGQEWFRIKNKLSSGKHSYLSLLQGDLALFFTADERPVTPEHVVLNPQLMSKGCWEETDPVLNYPLKIKSANMKTADPVVGLHTTQED